MKSLCKAVIAIAALTPGAVLAQASNFNYVEAKFLTGEVGDFDADGWGVQASVKLGGDFFLSAGASDQDLDGRAGFSAGFEHQNIGLGYVFYEDSVLGVLFGKFSLVNAETSVRGPGGRNNRDDDGWALGLGARFDLQPQTELRFGLDYADYGRNDSFIPSVGVVHSFTPRFAGLAELSSEDDGHTIGVGLRFYF